MHFTNTHYAALATLLLLSYFIRRWFKPGLRVSSVMSGLMTLVLGGFFTHFCERSNILFASGFQINVFYVSMAGVALALYLHLRMSLVK